MMKKSYLFLILLSFSFSGSAIHRHDGAEDSVGVESNYTYLINLLDSLNQLRTQAVDYQPSCISYQETPDMVFEYRMATLDKQTPITLPYNKLVKRYIDFYLLRHPKLVGKLLGLADFYFPLFEAELDKAGLPLELKYLPAVESALNPNAVSPSGATGLWQFMLNTGRLLDLKITSYIDERRDPIKSTQAACKYLSYLHHLFNNDWLLALAAYNAGPGTVQRAIIKAGGRYDFWAIRSFLPRETQSYVPIFIAMNYVMNYASAHQIKKKAFSFHYYDVDTLMVSQPIRLSKLARELHVPYTVLHFFNPAYRYGYKPRTSSPKPLVLPVTVISKFVALRQTPHLSPQEITTKTKVIYRVNKGDYLHKVAIKYGVSIDELRQWNRLDSDQLHTNQELIIWKENKTATIYE
jgi:membrane-bound lytic murein transglycosylase D